MILGLGDPFPRYVVAARVHFIPERHVTIDKQLERLWGICASVAAAFDDNSKERLIKSALKAKVLYFVLNTSQCLVTILLGHQ